MEAHLGTLSLQPANDFLPILLPVEFDWWLFKEIFLFYHPVFLSFSPFFMFFIFNRGIFKSKSEPEQQIPP